MDFNRAFRYIFDDKDWLSKVALGLLIMMVPILNFAWIGYQIQVIRNVRKNEAVPLPAWGENLGKFFMDGLMVTLANIVYALPIILVACLPLALMLIPAMASNNQDLFNVLMTGSMIVYFAFFCLLLVYGLVLSFVTPMVQILYAREGTFASCFKLREIFGTITRNAGPFFTVWLVNFGVSAGVGLAAGLVGGIIGWIPLLGQLLLFVVGLAGPAYAVYFSSHTYGQFMAQIFGAEG